MKLTLAWRNRLRNLTTIFLVLTVVAIIYTLIQWILSEPGSFEPLNVLFFAVFSVASAISAWLSRPDNVQPPASSEIALAETPAFGPLRQQISRLFLLEELRVLCLDLGIRYDALSGDTIDTKAASLLAYADRRGQLNKLMIALQQERPQAKWPVPNTLQTLYDLRRNVRATWIDGVLKQSVTDEIALELNLTLEPHALTRKVTYVPEQADKPIDKEVPQLFADFGSLLILGEPGSGKTMMLLQLAESLLNDAEQDATLLTPVVFNLSSWANEKKPLAEWLVEELLLQYQLPREAGRAMIQNKQLIYLLDGLDEVAEAARGACVQVINLFGEQQSGQLVVCCRATEYEALPHKLNLGMGVRIQPLAKAQVDDYFQRPELALEAVYQLWQTDEALQKLAQTPLFLSVITLAYRGLNQEALSKLDTAAARQDHLYRHYVAEMFRRRPLIKENGSKHIQALTLLINLAKGMQQNEQTQFYLELLQPTWLLNASLGKRISAINGVFWWLITSAIIWMPIALFLGIFDAIDLITFLYSLLFASLLGGMGGIIGFNSDKTIKIHDEVTWLIPSKKQLISHMTRGMIIGLGLGLAAGIGMGASYSIITRMNQGLAFDTNQTLLSASRFSLILGLSMMLMGGLIQGLQSYIHKKEFFLSNKPNQGIHNSLKNSVVGGFFGGLYVGLIGAMLVGLIITLFISLNPDNVLAEFANETTLYGVGVGFYFGSIFGTVAGMFNFGGETVVLHYTLRWLLAYSGVFPFSITSEREFVDFLDAMKDRIFLRRVGGGWIFIHRTLMDYFASLHPNAQVEVDHE